jgi:hypothetical protein
MPDPTRLRVAGFAVTAAGALLAGMGTSLVWTSTGLLQDAKGVLDIEFRGLDLSEGIVAFVVAGATLVGLVAVRRLHGSGRIRGAIGLLVGGALLVAMPMWVALQADDRAIEEVTRVVADARGLTVAEATDLVRTDPALEVRSETSGLWLCRRRTVGRNRSRDHPRVGAPPRRAIRRSVLERGQIRALRADAFGSLA